MGRFYDGEAHGGESFLVEKFNCARRERGQTSERLFQEQLIRQKHASSFENSRKIWKLAREFMPGGERIGVGKNNQVLLCLIAAYTKQMRSCAAAYRLCYQGLGIEADSHSRSMFAVLIYLRALERNPTPAEFARLWGIWCVANAAEQVQDASKIRSSLAPSAKKSEGLFAEEKRFFGKRWKQFLKYGPALKNLRELAREVASEDLYRVYYPQASAGPHGYDILKFIRPKEDGHTDVMLHPSDIAVFESLSGASHFLVDSLAVTNRLLSMRRDNLIQQMKDIVASFKPASIT